MAIPLLKDWIKETQDTDLNYNKLFFKEKIDTLVENKKFILNRHSILDKYGGTLNEIIGTVQLNIMEERKYFYNPKYLSYDLYGTVHLWHLLLDLNELYSTMEFTVNPVKIYSSRILSIINTVFDLENAAIIRNKDDIR